MSVIPLQVFGPDSRSQLLPGRCVEPSSSQMFPPSPGQVERRVLSMEGAHNAGAHDLQTVCPTRPQNADQESNVALRRHKPPRDSGKLTKSQKLLAGTTPRRRLGHLL